MIVIWGFAGVTVAEFSQNIKSRGQCDSFLGEGKVGVSWTFM